MSILIVDDDLLIGLTMVELLCKAGHEAFAFQTARDGLSILKTRHFDFVIADIGMSSANGDSLILEIKQHLSAMPVIAMAGYLTKNLREEAIRCGVLAIFQKPFDIDAVFAAINTHLPH
jgi:DNA-binding NtrC family response regulator